MKTILSLLAVLLIMIPTYTEAKRLTDDMMINQFKIGLPDEDEGTLYFLNDHSLILMPTYTNKTHLKTCWANWKLNEKNQTLSIRNADFCRVLNGEYRISKKKSKLYLTDAEKKLILHPLNP